MAHQSPLISIPRKTTTDVDWSPHIRSIIAQTYQEDPNAYSEEIAAISRCRQDAVRGASSDTTARDLLYKYFGQLEHLETRFGELKLPFIWNDAFTSKPTTQMSLAFEKASIIQLIAAVESQITASSSRADADGIKRATQGARKAAGMLIYINKNFLHAPSTDLSREVIDLLVAIMGAQQTEIFMESLLDKGLKNHVATVANRAANEYKAAADAMKEFEGKGVLDRNWLNLLQIKVKYFESLAQYHRSKTDATAGKHGQALVRLKLADTAAQEAQRLAKVFTYTFQSASTPTIPHDGATNLMELTKAHATLCTEAKVQAQRDNDLIYHEILPSEAALPPMGSLKPEPPIEIKEIFTPPSMTQLIGPDIFGRLVPMSVHLATSVYSEEKAKVVRQVVEKVDMSEGEIRAGLEHLGFPGLIAEWRNLAENDEEAEGEVDISSELARLADDVKRRGTLDNLVGSLEVQRDRCEKELRELLAVLDVEGRECERARAKYSPNFTQGPSGQHTGYWRETITSNLSMATSGMAEDSHIVQLSHRIRPDVGTLSFGREKVQKLAQEIAAGNIPFKQTSNDMSLLDMQDDIGPVPKAGLGQEEMETLSRAISEASEKLSRLGKIRAERDEVLKDLKEKVQNDDITAMLIMNSRGPGLEDQVIRGEIEKFTPYRSRISAAVDASRSIVDELGALASQVAQGKGVKDRQRAQKERKKRVREWEKTLMDAGAKYYYIVEEAGRGAASYEDVQRALATVGPEVRRFVSGRNAERNKMISDIETRQRLGSSPPPPPPSKQTPARNLESQMSAMSLGYNSHSSASVYGGAPPVPPQPSRPAVHSYGSSAYPPPPTPASSDPYSRSSSQTYPSQTPSAPSPYPPPPPGRPSQSPLYPTPHSAPSLYQAPPSTGQTSASYPSLTSPPPPSIWQQPAQAPSPHKYTTSPPPPVSYPSYAPPPQQQYSAYPAPPPAPPSAQPQYGGYQPPPQGYTGYQPPQSGYQPPQSGYQPPPSGHQPPQSGYPYR